MKIKFVKGIYGFVYDSTYGDITQIFDKPISKKERKTINKVISEDDMLFLEEDIEDIKDMFGDIEELQWNDKPILERIK
jgi:hypothetical protein